jgi:hypothetical protein
MGWASWVLSGGPHPGALVSCVWVSQPPSLEACLVAFSLRHLWQRGTATVAC